MAGARLTHPTRPTLPLYQRQTDEDAQEAVADIARETGNERPPLIHTRARQRRRSIRGLVTGNRRAANSVETDDKRQAIANFVDRLEAHCNSFQGEGYTFKDDLYDISLNGCIESVSWRRRPGRPDSIEYELSYVVGKGAFELGGIDRLNPNVDGTQPTMLRLDGTDLPGMRDYQVSREIGLEVNPVFTTGNATAERNDIVETEGPLRTIVYEGTATGSPEQRQALDGTLTNLEANQNKITLNTKFPGYNLEGFLIKYDNDQQARLGSQMSHYRIEFAQGI